MTTETYGRHPFRHFFVLTLMGAVVVGAAQREIGSLETLREKWDRLYASAFGLKEFTPEETADAGQAITIGTIASMCLVETGFGIEQVKTVPGNPPSFKILVGGKPEAVLNDKAVEDCISKETDSPVDVKLAHPQPAAS